jgi:hypothetical protein
MKSRGVPEDCPRGIIAMPVVCAAIDGRLAVANPVPLKDRVTAKDWLAPLGEDHPP